MGSMKLLSFNRGGRFGYGVVVDQGIVDLGVRYSERWPSLSAVIRSGALDQLRELAAGLNSDFSVDEVRFLPPILDPGRIICVGLNYKSHIEETGRKTPPYPTLFIRFPDSHVGHGEAIIRPSLSERHDFEGELAVIIGRSGRYIPAAEALRHIAGYSCYNDGSIRDFQFHSSQFTSGKNFWRSGAFGPWMVTTDEIPDPSQLHLETRLNGRVMQSAPTSDLMFDVPALVEYISKIFPLQPGDVISTGTTGGVGNARKPPIYMQAGDRIEVELSSIGTLSNLVEDESAMPTV